MKNIKKVFVYGSLRPDFTASYSKQVYSNSSLQIKTEKAELKNGKLFQFKERGYPTVYFETSNDSHTNNIKGFLIEDDVNFDELLRILDEIEEYPDVYNRKEVEVLNIERNLYENAYIYYENEFNNKFNGDLSIFNEEIYCIDSGDFMDKDYYSI